MFPHSCEEPSSRYTFSPSVWSRQFPYGVSSYRSLVSVWNLGWITIGHYFHYWLPFSINLGSVLQPAWRNHSPCYCSLACAEALSGSSCWDWNPLFCWFLLFASPYLWFGFDYIHSNLVYFQLCHKLSSFRMCYNLFVCLSTIRRGLRCSEGLGSRDFYKHIFLD